ncbi:MAG: Gfo/Idh/MocA family oxidoreductase, partial [Candidatus Aminicenantes bacterium]|nr:Gfo/Idh/MocA family oxidoreductase [Candidatus Aminicenantes bacterium]
MLNDEQKKLGRRNFLKAVATVPPTGALLWKTASMWPVKAGIIGIGGQGGVLMENAPPSHMKISAVCDIFPPNREKALKIAQERFDPDAAAYSDHRELLKRGDIEAVLIAAPLWMHEALAIDALNAGKHVFTEKAMAHSIDGCRRMIQAA